MSILNETYEMVPNVMYIVIAAALLILGLVLRFISNIRTLKNWQFALIIFLSLACFVAAPLLAGNYRDPDTYVPVGKKQIEAVLLTKEPNSYILSKYNVIEQRGRIWVLEEK